MATHIATIIGNKSSLSLAVREAEEEANKVLSREKFVAMQTSSLEDQHGRYTYVIALVTEYEPEAEA